MPWPQSVDDLAEGHDDPERPEKETNAAERDDVFRRESLYRLV